MSQRYGEATSYEAYVDGVIRRALTRLTIVLVFLIFFGWVIGYVHITLPSVSFGFTQTNQLVSDLGKCVPSPFGDLSGSTVPLTCEDTKGQKKYYVYNTSTAN